MLENIIYETQNTQKVKNKFFKDENSGILQSKERPI